MKRRDFILVPAKALSGMVLYSLVGDLIPLAAQDAVKVPLRFFTAEEARVIQSAAERIFPTDESGPGATEAGVVIYIDRQLASPYGKDKYRYTKGPWIQSIPEHGYQGQETPQQIYRAGIKLLGDNFAGLSPEEQDQHLESIESSYFFQLLAHPYGRRHVLRSIAWRQYWDGRLEVNWLSRPGDELPVSNRQILRQDLQRGSQEPGTDPASSRQRCRGRHGVK